MAEPTQNSIARRRNVFFSEEIGKALESLAQTTEVPMTVHIRRAIESYLKLAHDQNHRFFVTKQEALKAANISDDVWNQLKARKKETGLDLNEQVQVAVALYLQSNSQQSPTVQKPAVDFELTPPPGKTPKKVTPIDPNMEARLMRMFDEAFQEKTMTLFEQLKAGGEEVFRPVVELFPTTEMVLESRYVSCGPGDDVNVVLFIEDPKLIPITGELALKVTPHSFVAVAKGDSMFRDGVRTSIQSGEKILLTPLDEYPRAIKDDTIVLAKIKFKDGREVETLKVYERKRLRANNPDYPGFDLGPDMVSAEIMAVCRGKLPVVFD